MGTHSAIWRKDGSKYIGSYCHWDGDYFCNGRILLEHYNSEDLASALVGLGDLSQLHERIAPALGEHSFSSPQPNVTIAYHRDRGEELSNYHATTKESVLKESTDAGCGGYIYIFEDGKWATWKWLSSKAGEWTELTKEMCGIAD